MKRILTIAVLLLTALTAKAQTVEVLVGEQQKLFLEKTAFTQSSVSFAYIEATYNGGAMVKLFREQKWWEAPAYIHAEYQTTFEGNHTAILGVAYAFNLPHGSITLCPLARYDFGINKWAAQVSQVYFLDWKWFELYGYNHFWYNGSPCFFGEERAHLKLGDHLRLGFVIDLTYFGNFHAIPMFGIRWDMK